MKIISLKSMLLSLALGAFSISYAAPEQEKIPQDFSELQNLKKVALVTASVASVGLTIFHAVATVFVLKVVFPAIEEDYIKRGFSETKIIISPKDYFYIYGKSVFLLLGAYVVLKATYNAFKAKPGEVTVDNNPEETL